MPPNEDLPLGERVNRSVNLTLLVAATLAFPTVVCLHSHLGRRYAGPQALLSVLLLAFWPALDPHSDPRVVWWFLAGVLLMCLVSRAQGMRWKWQRGGDMVYRHYDGLPRLMRLLGCQNELLFKRLHEPLLVLTVGVALLPLSSTLGAFLIASAAGLFIQVNANAFARRERAEAMRDRLLEQSWQAERFRAISGK